MQIVREGEMWLAPQKVAAAYFGVSIQAFQKWDYEAVRKEGRSKLYDIRAIQNSLDSRYLETEDDLDLTAERARLAKEQADKTEMDNQVRRGELVETADVTRIVGRVIHATKTKILAIPSQIARYLENQSSQNIESQLNDALYDALDELGNQPYADAGSAKKVNGKRVGKRGKTSKRGGKRTTRKVAK